MRLFLTERQFQRAVRKEWTAHSKGRHIVRLIPDRPLPPAAIKAALAAWIGVPVRHVTDRAFDRLGPTTARSIRAFNDAMRLGRVSHTDKAPKGGMGDRASTSVTHTALPSWPWTGPAKIDKVARAGITRVIEQIRPSVTAPAKPLIAKPYTRVQDPSLMYPFTEIGIELSVDKEEDKK